MGSACEDDNEFGPHIKGVGEAIFFEGHTFHLDLLLTGGRGDDINLGGFVTVFTLNDDAWNTFFADGQGVDLYRFGIGAAAPLDRDFRSESNYWASSYIVDRPIGPGEIGGQAFTNIAGEEITVAGEGTQLTHAGQTYDILNVVEAGNGFLYQLSSPLVPGSMRRVNTMEMLEDSTGLSLMVEMIDRVTIPSLEVYTFVRDSIPLTDEFSSTEVNVSLRDALDGGYRGFTLIAYPNNVIDQFLVSKGAVAVSDLPQTVVDSLVLSNVFSGQIIWQDFEAAQASLNSTNLTIDDEIIDDLPIEDGDNIRTLTGRVHILSQLPPG